MDDSSHFQPVVPKDRSFIQLESMVLEDLQNLVFSMFFAQKSQA